MSRKYLGIDLGGTEVKIAVVDAVGKILEEKRIPNNSLSRPQAVIDEIVRTARALKTIKGVRGTGVGVAGDIDHVKGIVRFSPNLPTWKKVPLKKLLESKLPKPVVIDNDANAAALGALWLDARGKARNLICITLGTGVGGGIVCEGKVYRGATGTAGEIGHMPFDPEGPKCNCGSYGCIERYLGAAHLSRQAQEAAATAKTMMVKLAGDNVESITPKVMFEAADMGDTVALKLWELAGRRLGIVLAGIINLLNPEIIVLAGGISRAERFFLPTLRQTVMERAFQTPARACKIVVARHSHQLGVVGSALLAK